VIDRAPKATDNLLAVAEALVICATLVLALLLVWVTLQR
jgi:hypothetical protein